MGREQSRIHLQAEIQLELYGRVRQVEWRDARYREIKAIRLRMQDKYAATLPDAAANRRIRHEKWRHWMQQVTARSAERHEQIQLLQQLHQQQQQPQPQQPEGPDGSRSPQQRQQQSPPSLVKVVRQQAEETEQEVEAAQAALNAARLLTLLARRTVMVASEDSDVLDRYSVEVRIMAQEAKKVADTTRRLAAVKKKNKKQNKQQQNKTREPTEGATMFFTREKAKTVADEAEKLAASARRAADAGEMIVHEWKKEADAAQALVEEMKKDYIKITEEAKRMANFTRILSLRLSFTRFVVDCPIWPMLTKLGDNRRWLDAAAGVASPPQQRR